MSIVDKVQMLKQVLEVVLKICNVIVAVVDTVLSKIGE